jgi:arsenate reductase-like glutaredoxin family protein
LEEHGVPFVYREYRKEPLDAHEVRSVLKNLGVGPKAVLRRNDRAFKELGLTGDEDDDTLADLMAHHPTLLQRPSVCTRARPLWAGHPRTCWNWWGRAPDGATTTIMPGKHRCVRFAAEGKTLYFRRWVDYPTGLAEPR